jgi:hypothetical protein
MFSHARNSQLFLVLIQQNNSVSEWVANTKATTDFSLMQLSSGRVGTFVPLSLDAAVPVMVSGDRVGESWKKGKCKEVYVQY